MYGVTRGEIVGYVQASRIQVKSPHPRDCAQEFEGSLDGTGIIIQRT
jgi:hypothetical protein